MSKVIINKTFGEALYAASLVVVGFSVIKAYRPNYAPLYFMANVKRI